MTFYRKRNAYMLNRGTVRHGYDWWWHSFLAEDEESGELSSFFIEYYIINPALSPEKIIFGQLPENKNAKRKPSYSMIKAGKWGENKAQIHNFYPTKDFSASKSHMDVRIGSHTADDFHLKGSVSMGAEEAEAHPEYMSDAGSMTWDIKVLSKTPYSVGYGASRMARCINAFEMFWHVGGMITEYEGHVIFNGKKYIVRPETCAGYQDKNWGKDYTNPWIWLSCNRFRDKQGNLLKKTGLDIGGGRPKVFYFSIPKKILVAFIYKGKLYEFNFTKIFFQKQAWKCNIVDDKVHWDVAVENRTHALEVKFSCPIDTMLLVNYENPAGEKNHNQLWNGGFASGTLRFYEKKNSKKILLADLDGEYAGCEYGAY